ncbi:MAG: hypothetical protein U5L76_03065 [Patescibacteria group bacterium]|nr:hypothetical protein [Patescibacteria group bacterium]
MAKLNVGKKIVDAAKKAVLEDPVRETDILKVFSLSKFERIFEKMSLILLKKKIKISKSDIPGNTLFIPVIINDHQCFITDSQSANDFNPKI